ncbi:hypothetical protein Tco_0852259 [Tanacetum coccineum]
MGYSTREIADQISKMDPYEEVAQQGQAHPLSPAYVPDPIKLDEHVPLYALEPEHPEHHVPSDDNVQVEDQPYTDDASPTVEPPRYIADSDTMEEDTDEDSIDYPNEPGTDDDNDIDDEDEDLTEDEEEEHLAPADSSVVPVVDPVPSAGDTEAFETDESAPTPRSPQTRVPFSQTRLCRARKTVRLEPPMSASIEARIAEHAAAPIPPTNPTYDQAPLGHRAAMIRMRDDIPEEDMPPRRRFVLTAPPPGCDVAESSAAAAARAPRGQYDFVDAVEAGQGLIRSPGHDARTIARAADRAEDVGYVRALQTSEHRMMTSIEEVNLRVSYQAQVRRQESEIFYTQLHDARTDHRNFDSWPLIGATCDHETHMSRMVVAASKSWGLMQSGQFLNTRCRGARARIDTRWRSRTRVQTAPWTPESIQAMIDRAIQRNSTHTQDDASHNSGGGLRRPLESVFHISGCAVENQVKFATCTLLGAALTWWNGHVRTLGHDAAYAMTWGTFKKKLTDKYCPNGEIKKLEIEL